MCWRGYLRATQPACSVSWLQAIALVAAWAFSGAELGAWSPAGVALANPQLLIASCVLCATFAARDEGECPPHWYIVLRRVRGSHFSGSASCSGAATCVACGGGRGCACGVTLGRLLWAAAHAVVFIRVTVWRLVAGRVVALATDLLHSPVHLGGGVVRQRVVRS